MLKFFKKTKKQGWLSLGGILLCITGKNINAFLSFGFKFIVFSTVGQTRLRLALKFKQFL